ncbi:MAG: hypothetical protein IE887_08120 [Campylobacterales bacterium]|nr:hypothetical protein [Campylobacterales bacterium]
MTISNNISSIQASQTLLNTTANNVANSITAQTRSKDNEGLEQSQTDLSKEIPNMMIAQRTTEANVSVIKTQDDIMGTLLDIKA